MSSALRVITQDGETSETASVAVAEGHLDLVFAALSDPIRRRILQLLDGQALLVSELASQFNISLQGVSRHIQVLVRAGLVQQERSGRINRCSLEAGPLMEASVWLNRYAKYWQGQFDLLAATLAQIDERRAAEAAVPPVRPESDERPPRSAQPNAASTPAPRSPPRSRRAQQRVLQQADQPTDNRRRSKRRK